jgi:Trk K+ transport system NAD-binding subunit
MNLYAQPLYERLAPWLRIFERHHPKREAGGEPAGTTGPDAIVIGLGRYGRRLALKLQEAGVHVLGVDFDPEVTDAPAPDGVEVRFGDAQDPEFLDTLPLARTPWVVSTLPDLESNRLLLHALTERGYGGDLAIVARDDASGAALKRAGVPIVLYPVRNAVDYAVEHLSELMRPARPTLDKEAP